MTSYMNVKFSRELGKANSQFVLIFNEDLNTVRQTLEDNQLEENERIKANRRSVFYKQYADQ